VLRVARDRFLRLLIDSKDEMEFRLHERDSRADEHGDGKHIDSIPREKKEGKGYSAKQWEQKWRVKRKRSGSKAG
jgi:hypothetical protein